MGKFLSGVVVTCADGYGKLKSVQPGSREWVIVIQANSTEGQTVQPFVVVTGQNHLRNWYQESNLPDDWVIATSPNRWTNNETDFEWLKNFDKHTKARSTGVCRLLILEGHESHRSVDFERYCEENKIIILYMPPHSSRLLQPLDVGCFGPLKKAHYNTKKYSGRLRGAWIVPLDPESVISKLKVQLRAPTPVEEEASPPTLGGFKDAKDRA
ncbi:hypothetical protein HZ326_20375 [Fusarium oxysporum f. sp. albedinis]|nr:hypothetical protein HZ326_20375 [Fusarium oxysporum f. sp. albedinis]